MSNEDNFMDLDFINHERCIKVMKFISTIKINHKPCFNSLTTIDKNAWFTTFKRRWSGEKGEKGILYFKEILCSCDKLYRMCIFDVGDLLDLYQDSIPGIENLINTYPEQTTVCDGYKEILSIVKDNINTLIKVIDDSYDSDDSDGSDDYDGSDGSDDMDQKKVFTKYSLVPTQHTTKKITSFFNNKNIVYLKYQEE